MSPSMLLMSAALFVMPMPAVRAQDAAAAQKQFKTAAKQVIGDMVSDLSQAKVAALAAVAEFDKEVAQGDFSINLAITLSGAISAMQDAVSAELTQAANGLQNAAAAALADHGPFNDLLPLGFSPGDGGTLDDQREAAQKKAGAVVSVVRKRLEASSKKLLAKEGIPLFVLIRTPQMLILSASDVGTGGWLNPVRIDLALSAGGIIVVAGDAAANLGSLSLTVTTVQGAFKFVQTGLLPGEFSDRFLIYSLDDEFLSAFAPGIYGLQITQGNQGWDAVQVGAR